MRSYIVLHSIVAILISVAIVGSQGTAPRASTEVFGPLRCITGKGGFDCTVEISGLYGTLVADTGERRLRKQGRQHPGEPGLSTPDGHPAPDHQCSSCHEEEDLLSDGHLPTADMSMRGCRICHGKDDVASLDDRLFQSHTHFFAGVECKSCHQNTDEPEIPEAATCLSCHGPLEDLALKTSHVEHANPHASPHGTPYSECSLCHYQHEPPDNFCASCHDFDFRLP